MNLITPTCQIVRLVVAGMNVSHEMSRLPEVMHGKEIHVANAIFKTLAIAFNAGALGAHLEGASLQTEENFKILECLARSCLVFPSEAANLVAVAEGRKTASAALIDSMTPLLSLARAVSEESSLGYQYLATLPDEERKVPVNFDGFDPHPHWEYLTVEQCIQRASTYNNTANGCHGLELLSETNTYANTLIKTFQNVINQVHRTPATLSNLPAAAQAALPLAEPVDPLAINLVGLPFIPEALHQDPLFNKFICPISRQPVRHPLRDPTDKTIYDKASITIWLVTMGETTSPLTRLPLNMNTLIEMPVLEGIITNRLQYYQSEIEAAINRREVLMPTPDERQRIEEEAQVEWGSL